jgi:hypothetical protein
MTPNDLREDLRAQPFRPIRLVVSDGSHYDIQHPELCMVGLGSVIIGLSNDPNSPFFERTVRMDNRAISHVLPLPVTTPPEKNGPASPHA